MASPSRTTQFTKVHKVLKKHYRPVLPDPNRPVLEHLLFACCAENAHYDAAEEAFAALVHNFFDFNEVRVSSVRELSEVMSGLPEPAAAAHRVKRVLQSVFESTYSFDLEELRKLNLGPASERLTKLDGSTAFSVAYVVQAALGGHAIPVDLGVLRALCAVDLISEEDLEAGTVPGLERAVAKSKGLEFASLLHQLGADFIANPYAPPLRQVLVEINPDAAQRLPKRRTKRQAQAAAAQRKRRRSRQQQATQKGRRQRPTDPEAQQPENQGEQDRGGPKKKSARRKKATGERESDTAPTKDASAKRRPSSAARKGPGGAKKKPTAEKPDSDAPASPETQTGKKKSASSGLSKRKPR